MSIQNGRYKLLALLVGSLFAIGAANGAEETAVTVNNVAVPKAQLDLLVASFVAQGTKESEELRKQLIEELATREVVAQEAVKLGLDKKPEIVAALANSNRDILVNAYQADYAAKHPVTEKDIQYLYDKQKEEAGPSEYRIRNILVKTEEEAKAIQAALMKGSKFEALAREKSLDSASRAAGGDIGWQVPILLVPPVRETIKTLDKGKISAPVQSQFGWHILRIDDTRPYAFPPLNQVKSALRQQAQTQVNLKAISEMRKQANVNF